MSVYDRSQENEKKEQSKGTSSNGETAVLLQDEDNATQKRKRRVARWYYDFTIEGRRYKGPIPGARNRKEAEKVELQKRLDVYEGRYGKELGTEDFTKFVNEVYLPASKPIRGHGVMTNFERRLCAITLPVRAFVKSHK